MKKTLRRITPKPVWGFLSRSFFKLTGVYYRYKKRPVKQLETSKAKERRIREGFFEKYCKGKGLDIGYGGDLLAENCRGWDIEDGDAESLAGLKNVEFDFVYSSHTLEHMENVQAALNNWWRVVKPGGYLILYLPERNLYERKETLPSRWNTTHRRFFLLDRDQGPDTVGIIPLIQKNLNDGEIILAKVCDDGYGVPAEDLQSVGEYSIEAVIRKNAK